MIDYDSHDWYSHLLDIKGSMVREIFGRVTTSVVWAAMVVGIHKAVMPVSIPSTMHTLIGLALGLLLVFRTNASYDRFWEGRRMWGAIVNESRNVARLSRVHLAEAPDLRDRAIRWTAAFAYASMHALRGQAAVGPVRALLPEEEVEADLAASSVPLAVATRITAAFREARDRGVVSDIVLYTLDNNVQLFMDYFGACERIRKTPLPFAYVVHLRRALILYSFTLPVALVDPFGWSTIPTTFLLAYVFFGIEEIGVEIEDPFGVDDNDLPLEGICGTIARNLLEVDPSSLNGPPAAEVLDQAARSSA